MTIQGILNLTEALKQLHTPEHRETFEKVFGTNDLQQILSKDHQQIVANIINAVDEDTRVLQHIDYLFHTQPQREPITETPKKKPKQSRKHQQHERALEALQKEAENRELLQDSMTVGEALNRLPDNMLVNLHFQECINQSFRNVTVRYAKQYLPKEDRNRIVSWVRHDLNFDGSKDPAPVALLELPRPKKSNFTSIWG